MQLASDDRADFEHALGVVIARTEQLNEFMRSFADVVRLPCAAAAPVDLGRARGRLAGVDGARGQAPHRDRARRARPTVDAVPIDRGQIEQALLNVLKNGLEAIGQDGTLTVRLLASRRRPVIEIEDTGPGSVREVRSICSRRSSAPRKAGRASA